MISSSSWVARGRESAQSDELVRASFFTASCNSNDTIGRRCLQEANLPADMHLVDPLRLKLK